MQIRSAGEIEAAVSAAVCRVMKEMHGCGAKSIRTYLVDDVLLIMLFDVLSLPQRRMASVGSDDDGQSAACLKKYRGLLWRNCREALDAAIREVTGLATRSLFYDVCFERGAEILVFQLDERPVVRMPRP